jgi:cytochrome c peroxidase
MRRSASRHVPALRGRAVAAWLAVLALLGMLPARAAELTLAFHVAAEGERLAVPTAPGESLRLGRNELTLTRVAGLVSGVALVRPDASLVQLDGQFGALDLAAGRDRLTLRGVPPGRYQGFQFLLGVRPAANHSDPAQWPAGHPLHPLINGLHWDWQGGYIFLALEGRYRRADATLGGWSYHLATDARLTLVAVPFAFEFGDDSTLALELDLARLLSPLRFAPDTDTTHSRPGDLVADHLEQTLPAAFRVTAYTATPRSFVTNLVTNPSSLPATLPIASPVEQAEIVTNLVTIPPAPPPGGASGFVTRLVTVAGRPLAFVVPAGFPQVELPADNPLTYEGVALGEKLFRDPRLSGDGTLACIDCHRPEHGFSDPRALSLGTRGLPGQRHSMPLFNLAWSPNFAWDGAQPRIRDQALAAMRNPLEMDADPARVAARLDADAALAAEFRAAFGPAGADEVTQVTPERIGAALEQFLLTLVEADSKFDRALRGETTLSEQEQEGFALFSTEFDPARGQRGADCFHCHGGRLFTDYQMKHNGLDFVSADPGRGGVTGSPADRGKFKTPSLRNIARTAPYMHDGRFGTLEEVIEHYATGVRRADNLDPNLAKHPAAGLSLTHDEKAALLAFLRTL